MGMLSIINDVHSLQDFQVKFKMGCRINGVFFFEVQESREKRASRCIFMSWDSFTKQKKYQQFLMIESIPER